MKALSATCLICCALASAQSPAGRSVDVGIADAPLSTQDQADLTKAFAAHDYAAESTVLTRALKANPEARDIWIVAGRIAFLERHPRDAADALERADGLQRLGENDRMTLALAYQSLGKLTESRSQLVQLTNAEPKNARYFYLLARLDRQNQELEKAQADFRRTVELDPGMMRAWEELAQVQEGAGHVDEARKTYEAAAERNRLQKVRWEGSPLDLGVFLLKAGDLSGAEKLVRESLEYNPRFPLGHYYLGQILEKQAKNADAVTEYQAAVVRNPRFREAWVALHEIYTKMGMKEQAEKALDSAAALSVRPPAQ